MAPFILPEVPTESEIIRYVESALDPAGAAGLYNGSLEQLCSTGVIERVSVDGNINLLDRKDGKYLIVYLRVSTDEQAKHGYSVGDQARRGILYAIKNAYAFRIVSDATLSGWLPYEDIEIIRRMLDLKAERYAEAFDSVYLNDYNNYSDAERKRLLDYREEKCQTIRDGITRYHEDPNAPQEKRRGTSKRGLHYRPGLTTMIHALPFVHEIAVTDQSRLSRNYALMSLLAEKFHKHNVNIRGLIEPIMRGRDAAAMTTAAVLGVMAEAKLFEVARNAIRGHERMFMVAKKPFASIPSWVERDKKTGQARFRVETEGPWAGQEARRKAIERIVELFLQGSGSGKYGPTQLVYKMMEEGYPDPTGKGWQIRTVHQILQSRTLLGEQEAYGLRHKVLPAICDENTFDRIQERLKQRRALSHYDGNIEGEIRLGTGLLRCVCGRKMVCAPSRNGYVCPVTLHSRLDKSVRHTVLKIDDWHKFLDSLMTTHIIDWVVQSVTGDDRTKDLQSVIDSIRERLEKAQANIVEQRAGQLPIVKNGLAGMGISEYDPDYEGMKERALNAKVRPLIDAAAQLEALLQQQQEAKENYVPPVAYKDFSEQLREWDTLPSSVKNRIIRVIFREFQAGGVEPDLHLTPIRRTAINAALPPIPLILTQRGQNWLRRLPDAREWVKNLRATLQGDEWFGEFQNFGWTQEIRGNEDEDEDGITTSVTVVPYEMAA